MPTPEEKAVDVQFGAVAARAEEAGALASARAEGRRFGNDEVDALVASLYESSLTSSVVADRGNPERSQ